MYPDTLTEMDRFLASGGFQSIKFSTAVFSSIYLAETIQICCLSAACHMALVENNKANQMKKFVVNTSTGLHPRHRKGLSLGLSNSKLDVSWAVTWRRSKGKMEGGILWEINIQNGIVIFSAGEAFDAWTLCPHSSYSHPNGFSTTTVPTNILHTSPKNGYFHTIQLIQAMPHNVSACLPFHL